MVGQASLPVHIRPHRQGRLCRWKLVKPMSNDQMLEIDRYIEQLCVPRNEVFEQALRDAAAAGLPEIHVSPNEGKLLYLLAKISGTRRMLAGR